MSEVKKNILEWIVFAVSLVLVMGVIGYLSYDAATLGNRPPDIQVLLGVSESRTQGFAIPVTVRNTGEETAEGVRVEVELKLDGADAETGELEFPFVPRGGQREGFVAFKHDPNTGRLETRVLGYE
ncbi:MAG: hypothetical protein MSG64_00620 [Pyrinomonadaceae bacterium MAG19_C2-C3]|nr:hypothetical protein [Pyrinomonadaceae bacterium MAG19_C2-C3]